MVLHELAELAMPFEEKNIADDTVAAELIARGGKRQVPYLVDSETNTEMYESSDIVDYLVKKYGTDSDTKKNPETPNVCIPE